MCASVYVGNVKNLQILCKNYMQDGSREKHEERKLIHKFSTMWIISCMFLKRSTIFTCFECLHLKTLNVNKDDLRVFNNSSSKIQIYRYQTLRNPSNSFMFITYLLFVFLRTIVYLYDHILLECFMPRSRNSQVYTHYLGYLCLYELENKNSLNIPL